MKRGSLASWVFGAFTLFTILLLAGALCTGRRLVRQVTTAQLRQTLQSALPFLVNRLEGLPEPPAPEAIQDVCQSLHEATGFRFTVLDADGAVLGDGEQLPGRMENHAQRPEVRAALALGYGQDRRFSATVGRPMHYAAMPLRLAGDRLLIVRVALGQEWLDAALRDLRGPAWLLGLALLAGALLLSLLFARLVVRPLQDLRRGIATVTAGHLDRRVPYGPVTDINQVAESFNKMTAELDDRLSAMARQHETERALLSCMREGVLAVDHNQHILRLNRAAAELFEIPAATPATGEPVVEFVRDPELIRLMERVLAGAGPIECWVKLANGQRVLQANGVPLHDPDGVSLGALIVLSDVTALHRIETIQRDFVANVSHELKTPITSIRGFAETLLDQPPPPADTQRHFLEIILRQADRLQSLIADTLSLSALEHGARERDLEFERVGLKTLFEQALIACRTTAETRQVTVDLQAPDDLDAEVNAFFLEQAVVNLLDNAIKFSPAGATVTLSADAPNSNEIRVQVQDHGPGIAFEHQSRIWERFYRVDKGRDRQRGGTGLGLAIVKRVAVLHGGRAEVESQPGAGATLRLILPRRRGRSVTAPVT